MANIKLVIFDFDGTVADTFKYGVKIANSLSSRFKYDLIMPDKEEHYRGKSAQEILKEAGISWFKLPFVATRFQIEFSKVIDELMPCGNIIEVIKTLSKKYELGIITSNSEKNVNRFLENNNLTNIFSFIISNKKLFGKAKTFKKIIKDRKLVEGEFIYIGDETRDIEAAKKLKVKIISCSWGFNTYDLLKKFEPDYLINKPEEILDII